MVSRLPVGRCVDMALARCDECGQVRSRKKSYAHCHDPLLSYPNSDIICGSVDCENPAHIWLTEDEEHQYKAGQRVFQLLMHTSTAKVRLK